MNRNTPSALVIAISLASGYAALNKSAPVSSAPAASPKVERSAADLATSETAVWANGVSADGSVIVGAFQPKDGVPHAYRWTQSGGAQDLGTMGGRSAEASGVSRETLIYSHAVD